MSTTTSPDSLTAAVTTAGALIRYSFYAAGAFVLIVMAIIPFMRSDPVRRVDEKPAFRLTSSELARQPVVASVIAGRGGRVEMLQYGRLHDRDKDFTVMMVMPPKGSLGARDFMFELRELGPLNGAALFNAYHDLQTRFGPVRAREFRINADGRIKLCLAYLSRFDTPSVYLKGWYCEASGAKAGPWELACALDSLVLDQPLASSDADTFLRERAKRQRQCSAQPVTQTTDTRPPRPTVRRY